MEKLQSERNALHSASLERRRLFWEPAYRQAGARPRSYNRSATRYLGQALARHSFCETTAEPREQANEKREAFTIRKP